MPKILAAIFTLLAWTLNAEAAEFHVSPTADADCSDFNCSLEQALSVAAANGENDTIILSHGVYNPQLPVGNFPHYNPAPSEIADLTLLGEKAKEGEKSILDGSTLSGEGAAILRLSIGKGDLTVENITFQGGRDNQLIGLFIEGGKDINISECEFSNNAGGLSIVGAPVSVGFDRDTFFNNLSDTIGGLKVSAQNAVVSVVNSLFSNNSATNGGGAAISAASIAIVNSVFSKNVGGGLNIETQTSGNAVSINNSTFFKNQGTVGGTSIQFFQDTAEGTISNSILLSSSNINGDAIEDIFFDAAFADFNGDGKGGLLRLHNNDFGKIKISCFECNARKEELGNFNKDPLFMNAENEDFHLSPSSPCVNAATSEPDLVTLPSFDFDGNPRIFGSAPDMGAFELQQDPSPGSGGGGGSGGCSLVR